MKTRTLGARTPGQGLEVSAVGLGCMGMSGGVYGERDEERSMHALHRAADLGLTFFDTSDMYGDGHNEEFLGRFLRERRLAATVATKFGIRRKPGEYAREIDNSPEYARLACEASLKRLGIERIDLYYVHRIEPGRPIEEVMGALADLVREGKIAHIGLSEAKPETLRRAHAVHPVTALQTEYSLMQREVESDVLPTCRELGIGFVPYSPLGRGFLTGAIRGGQDFAQQDFRRMLPRFREEAMAANAAFLDAMRSLAEARGATLAQVALAWVLAEGESIVPIPGTTRAESVEQNIAAAEIVLEPAERAALREAIEALEVVGARYTDEGFKGVNE